MSLQQAVQPIEIQLTRGVLVTGKVVSTDGSPLEAARVRSITSRQLAVTEADGSFRLLLPREAHTIVVGSDEPGFILPNRSDAKSISNEQAATGVPQMKVDLSDGVERELPPIVVSRTRAIQVNGSLPDGRPATGARVIIRDERTTSNSNNRMPSPFNLVEKSAESLTNQFGRAEFQPIGVTSDKAFIEVKLTTGANAYHGTVALSEAVDGVVSLVLESAWLLEGRALIEGTPMVGARVQISQMAPIVRSGNGMFVPASMASNIQFAMTDNEGRYRAAVERDKQYSVSLNSIPEYPNSPFGIGFSSTIDSDGRPKVKDFAFTRHTQEIAGRVVDLDGNAVVNARVSVVRTVTVEPHFWYGHQQESQLTTDRQGRIHLKKMLKGSYQLMVSGPRINNQQGSSTTVSATTGTMDLDVVLVADRLHAEPPQLLPR